MLFRSYAPLFVKNKELKEILIQDDTIKTALQLAQNADVILTSVGSVEYKTYDGKIETESDLDKVTDTNRKVKPEEQKIVTQTIFIWHEEEQKISDFTFQKMDDKTKQPMQGVEWR